jgi:hypothetical protein
MFWSNLLKSSQWNSHLDLSLLVFIWIPWTSIQFFLPLVPSNLKQFRMITTVFIAPRTLRRDQRPPQWAPPIQIQI